MIGLLNKRPQMEHMLTRIQLEGKLWEIPDFEKIVTKEREKGSLMTLAQSINFIGKSDFFQHVMPTSYPSKHHNKSLFLTPQEVNSIVNPAIQNEHWKSFIIICGLFGIHYNKDRVEKFQFPTQQTKSEFYNSNKNLYTCITRIIDSLDLVQGKQAALDFVSFLLKNVDKEQKLRNDVQRAIDDHWLPRSKDLREKIEFLPRAIEYIPRAAIEHIADEGEALARPAAVVAPPPALARAAVVPPPAARPVPAAPVLEMRRFTPTLLKDEDNDVVSVRKRIEQKDFDLQDTLFNRGVICEALNEILNDIQDDHPKFPHLDDVYVTSAKHVINSLLYMLSEVGREDMKQFARSNRFDRIQEVFLPNGQIEYIREILYYNPGPGREWIVSLHMVERNVKFENLFHLSQTFMKIFSESILFIAHYKAMKEPAQQEEMLKYLNGSGCLESRLRPAALYAEKAETNELHTFSDLMQKLYKEAKEYFEKTDEGRSEFAKRLKEGDDAGFIYVDRIFQQSAGHTCKKDPVYCPDGVISPDGVYDFLVDLMCVNDKDDE